MNTHRGVEAVETELHAFSASALDGYKEVGGSQNAMGATAFPPLPGIGLRIVGCSVVAILTELFSFPTDGETIYKLDDNIKRNAF
jgi:hypothetical protein